MYFLLFPSVYPFVLLFLLTIEPLTASASGLTRDISQEEFIDKGSFSKDTSELSLVSDEAAAVLENEGQSSSTEILSRNAGGNKHDSSVLVVYSQLGPGEMGSPLFIENPTPAEAKLIADGYRKNGFNQFISDRISVNRTLPDYRSAWCQKPHLYSRHLLSSSVIISFHNEAWSTLLRTIHSVLDRTPAALLSEIVLIDDFSDRDHLKKPLDEYVKTLPKVQLVRLHKREGLIRARMIGANIATGPVLTFLDSHVEVTEGWLEPLVDRVTRNKTNVVSPIIDVIDPNTFEFRSTNKSTTVIGSFQWTLQFRWHQASDKLLKELRSPEEPLPTPVIGLGMFSIHKEFFMQIGGFDESLEIWGGETLEISFKTWMCGGRLEISPCSHIGHIYRKQPPYSPNGKGNFQRKNLIRVASVWLDEYAQYHFSTISNDLGDVGDIDDRMQLKTRLQCKSFDWYMNNVAYDHFNPKKAVAEGEIRNLAYGAETCLDSPSTKNAAYKQAFVFPCHKLGGNQHWYYTSRGELRRDNLCLDYSGTDVIMYPCHGNFGNQRWLYNHENGLIVHGKSRKCIAMDERDVLSMTECEDRITLRWQMEHFNQHNAKHTLLLENKSFKYPK